MNQSRPGEIRVLIVEDEPIAADAHAEYVTRLPGFVVAGRAATGAEALRVLERTPIDLVLLDMHLPDVHGLTVVRAMRAAGHHADVIALTAARDLAVVRAAVSQGVVHYLIKPFTFRAVRDKLQRYQSYRDQLTGKDEVVAQHEVDDLLRTLRDATPTDLPKGMSRESLAAVVAAVRSAATGLSAAEVGEVVGASRVTARRYLEYLAETGLTDRHPRYRTTGRPEVEYHWKPGNAPPLEP